MTEQDFTTIMSAHDMSWVIESRFLERINPEISPKATRHAGLSMVFLGKPVMPQEGSGEFPK